MPEMPLPNSSRALHAKALRLDAIGAHHHAEPLFARLLATAESAIGADQPDLAEALNDLARCRFNAGQFHTALHTYQRLLRLLEVALDDARIGMARHQIQRCIEGLRQRDASAALQAHLTGLIRLARSQRAVGETIPQHRIRALGRRLIARGKVDRGARLLQWWANDLIGAGQAVDDEALGDLRDHAIGLWNAGHPHLAEPMMRAIVRVHQRGQDDDPGRIAGAMRDWGSCLAACGQDRSARETFALANALTGTSARDKPTDLPGPNGQDGCQA